MMILKRKKSSRKSKRKSVSDCVLIDYQTYCLSVKNLKKKMWHSVVYVFYREWPVVVRKENTKGI